MYKKFAAVGAAVFALALPLAGAQVSAAPGGFEPVPPGKITIEVVTVNGSGCPKDTAAVAVAPDNTAFTVTYSQYTAAVGPGSGPMDFRKNCQLNLKVNVPQGFTYGIAQADYRGFASLAKGATALERARYYFQGNSPTDFVDHTFKGPFADDWQETDKTEVSAIVYAPCGERRNFNINTQLRVDAGKSDPKKDTSFITMDSTDGSINTTYHFAWKECPTKP
ncbi:DUF4360 domain-containing protein [Nocardia altamirensis]|uniref:DUF4360 domain-containing protein n=1 Tax=Nocardia altamirensis TaxID=472158 RepID=UPI0009FE7908|nr:DUF4360 domain-containing protein [Nocardia altamirensis]